MRVRNEHWVYLVNFAELRPCIITNKHNKDGRHTFKKLWEQLVGGLNSLGYGEKSMDEWKKALTDWKSKSKLKASQIKNDMERTGGGPLISEVLSDVEERLLKLMGDKCIEGDISVHELGLASLPSSSSANDTLEKQGGYLEVTNELENENINIDHNYNKQIKRKRISTIGVQRPRKRNNLISKEILTMNEQTLNVLRDLNSNVDTISATFIKISKTLDEIKQELVDKNKSNVGS